MSYTFNKIQHLKRSGLIAANKSGHGMNGGACPDWLVSEQEANAKRLDKAAVRSFANGARQPDIEWVGNARIYVRAY